MCLFPFLLFLFAFPSFQTIHINFNKHQKQYSYTSVCYTNTNVHHSWFSTWRSMQLFSLLARPLLALCHTWCGGISFRTNSAPCLRPSSLWLTQWGLQPRYAREISCLFLIAAVLFFAHVGVWVRFFLTQSQHTAGIGVIFIYLSIMSAIIVAHPRGCLFFSVRISA